MEKMLISILEDICKTDDIKDDLDVDLFEYGYLDSLDVMELLVRIEEKLKVKIQLSEINRDDISTPNKIIELINNKAN